MDDGRLDPGSLILTPGSETRQTVGDFWSWAYSNVLTNVTRGLFAEFLVGAALEAVDGTRTEWDSYDLCYEGAHIEVKSSAYLQSWPQAKPSKIGWSISPSTYRYDEIDRDQDDQEPPADCYVFCVYTEKKDRNPALVLDSEKWLFYVVPTTVIRKKLWHQKTVTESSIKALVGEPVRYSHLRERVKEALSRG